MLDRATIEEFLEAEFWDYGLKIPLDRKKLVEAFCQYVENGYYEWLKDNF